MWKLKLSHCKSSLLIVFILAMAVVLQFDALAGKPKHHETNKNRDSPDSVAPSLPDLVRLESYSKSDATEDSGAHSPGATTSAKVGLTSTTQDVPSRPDALEPGFQLLRAFWEEQLSHGYAWDQRARNRRHRREEREKHNAGDKSVENRDALSPLRDLVRVDNYAKSKDVVDPIVKDPANASAGKHPAAPSDDSASQPKFDKFLDDLGIELRSEEETHGDLTVEPTTDNAVPSVDDRQLFESQLRACVQESLLAGLPSSVAELTTVTHSSELWKGINAQDDHRTILLNNLHKLRRRIRYVHPCRNEATHENQLKCVRRNAEKIKQQVLERAEQLTKGIHVLGKARDFMKDVYKAHGDFSSLPESQDITRVINKRKLLATLSTDSDPQGMAAILDNGLVAFEDDFQSREDMNMLRLAVSAKLFLLRDYETANRMLDGIATDKLISNSASEVLAALQRELVGNGVSKSTRSLLDVLGSDLSRQIESMSSRQQERLDELLRSSHMAAELESIILIDMYGLCDDLLYELQKYKASETKEPSSP
jgi:hypothetical protein